MRTSNSNCTNAALSVANFACFMISEQFWLFRSFSVFEFFGKQDCKLKMHDFALILQQDLIFWTFKKQLIYSRIMQIFLASTSIERAKIMSSFAKSFSMKCQMWTS